MKYRTTLVFILFFHLLIGQVSYSNEFLNIGVGARSHAMSGTVEASVNDINAAYWNPAGLSNINSSLQLGVMHSDWFGGVGKYDHISIAKSLKKEKRSVGAISMIRLAIDQIPNTLNLVGPDGSIRFENVSEFSAVDYGFLLSYASALGKSNVNASAPVKSLFAGGNIKIIRRLIGPFASAWGFGIDAGLQWIRPHWQLGISGHDLSTTFTGWKYTFTEEQKVILAKTNNIIPVSTLEKTLPRLGVAFEYKVRVTDKISLHPEAGFNMYFDGKRNTVVSNKTFSLEPKLGIELGYHDLAFIRFGYGNIQKIKDEINLSEFQTRGQLNAGLGIKIGKVCIDYALANIGNLAKEINYSHVFSATLNFTQAES
ncbi:MAG: hypothetical protein ABIR66_07425, partial [Saprospiraceae bacterium]